MSNIEIPLENDKPRERRLVRTDRLSGKATGTEVDPFRQIDVRVEFVPGRIVEMRVGRTSLEFLADDPQPGSGSLVGETILAPSTGYTVRLKGDEQGVPFNVGEFASVGRLDGFSASKKSGSIGYDELLARLKISKELRDDPKVSSMHAHIRCAGDDRTLVVDDSFSTNGTEIFVYDKS